MISLLASATVVAERYCFHKRVSLLLSTEGVGWGMHDEVCGGGGVCVEGGTDGTHPTGMHSCCKVKDAVTKI